MKTVRKTLCLVLVFCISTLSSGPLQAQAPAPAAAPPAGDPWPRQIKSGTDTYLIYQPQLDSWSGQPARGALRGVGEDRGGQGSDVRGHLVHGADRGRQGQSRRLPRGPEHHALELSLRAGERGRLAGRAAGKRAGQEIQGDRARPAAGGSRHRHREEGRRVASPEQRATADRRLQRARRPGPRRRRSGLSRSFGHGPAEADQHELDPPAGRLRRALPPPLRRLDEGLDDPGPVGGRRPPLRPQGGPRQGPPADPGRKERRPDDGRLGGGSRTHRSRPSRPSPCRWSTWPHSRPS